MKIKVEQDCQTEQLVGYTSYKRVKLAEGIYKHKAVKHLVCRIAWSPF